MVVLPVDDLHDAWPSKFHNNALRLGALLHPASMNSRLESTLSQLQGLHGSHFQLSALFGPQHGYDGSTQDNMIEWQGHRDPRLGIPIHSLYGDHRQPTPEMLADLDVLFVDLVDVGSRYYTFIWTLLLCLKAADAQQLPVIVCDRPNPINGVTVEGEPQDSDYLSFVGLHQVPIRHARTIGELARQFQQELFPSIELTVLPIKGWQRSMWYDDTGLPWVLPSPNMPTLDTAIVYPGMCLLEGTNLSEGRGTTRPFEIFGAPWIDPYSLVAQLNEKALPGVVFRPMSFEPTFQKHARQLCHGAQIHVQDREALRPVELGLEILRCVQITWPTEFGWNPPPYEYEYEKQPIEILLGGPVERFGLD